MSGTISESQLDLTQYLEFIPANNDARRAIRVAGTRVGVEFVLRDYLNGASPEELALRFPTVSLEQIYALITYYLARQSEMNAYLDEVWQDASRDAAANDSATNTFAVELRNRLTTMRPARQ